MIKGKQKEKLNDFELEIELLLGNHHEKTGYIYYFELLHETFTRAAKHLILDSQQFKKELLDEDTENIQSLIQSNESIFNPLIQSFYNSYFITVHSELEIMLTKLKDIVLKYYDNQNFPKKANPSFRTFKDEENKLTFIKNALSEHDILVTYNYIRNGITHAKNVKTCSLYIDLEKHIKSGKINFIKIMDNNNGFNYLITEIDFIVNYREEIISFFLDLINNSIKYRKQNC